MSISKVSVVIPVYNVETYLRQCMDSVINQTLREIEIICVDDGSTDASLRILHEYSEMDSRIAVIHQENQGAAVARNKAMEMCRGEFIAFMDPDDFYPDNNVLYELYTAAKDNNCLVCGGTLSEVDESTGESLGKMYSENDPRWFVEDKRVVYAEYQYDYYYQRFIFDRKMLTENSICFPEYRRFQDPPFFVKAMIAAQEFYALKRTTYCYRVSNKYKNWTEEKLNYYIKGNNDLLEMSNTYHLDVLHKKVARRIMIDYVEEIISWMSSDAIRKTLERTKDLLRPELFPNDSIFQNGGIDALFFANQWRQKLVSTKEDKNTRILRNGNAISPLVSVIIPVYDVEKYLLECLKSISNQTLRNIEMICVNDGSTDQSLKILMEYAVHDNRITVITQNNGGLSCARNAGAKYAKGKYIYFMDSDDWLEEDALEIAYKAAVKDKLDMVVFDAVPFTEFMELEGQKHHYEGVYRRKHRYEGVYKGSRLLRELLDYDEYTPSACLKVLSRDFFIKNELWFYDGILHEDNIYSDKAFLLAEKVMHIPRTFFHRRIRNDSIMTKQTSFANVYGLFCCYMEIVSFYKGHDLDGDGQKSALERISRILSTTRSRYMEIPEIEKYAEYALADYERMMFHDNIVEAAKYKKMQNDTYNRLKRAWDEKSELYEKLQKTKEINQTKIYELEGQKENLNNELLKVQNSISYRLGLMLTAPMRFLVHFIRGDLKRK